ncbi:MAG: HEAT repeat domain-containing protein [Planctomycetota bacterium]|jgi:HEAT repeat protein
MRRLDKKVPLLPEILTAAVIGLILYTGFAYECRACGGGGYSQPLDISPNEGGGSDGAETTESAPAAATGGRSAVLPSQLAKGYILKPAKTRAGSGGLTRKSKRRTTPQVTWEIWWARNRYQFFEIKDLYENTAELYPITPRARSKDEIKDLFSGVRHRSAETIRNYLDSKHAAHRRIAVLALGRLKDPGSVKRMMDCLQENNKYVRNTAIVSLGIHGSPEARHTLFHIALGTDTACRLLGGSSVNEDLRVYAIVVLAATSTPGIKPVLQTIALDESAPRVVRAMAVEGLGLAGGEDSAAFLVELSQDPKIESYLLSYALTSLGKTGEAIGLPALRKNLYSKDLQGRQAAAMGLGCLAPRDDDKIIKELYTCFRHTNDQALEGFSLAAMGLIGGPEAMKKLRLVSTKGKSSEQAWACLGLGFALRDLHDAEVVCHLIKQATTRGNRSICGAAVIALGIGRCREAVPHLVKMLKSGDDPLLRGYCAQALGMIDDEEALPHLRKSLEKDRLPVVVSQVVLAMGLMNDRDSVPVLAELMISSPSATVKSMISWSLMYMGDTRTVDIILEALDNEGLDVHTSVVSICLLSRLLSSQTKRYMDRLAAFSNFACEFPIVGELLNSSI